MLPKGVWKLRVDLISMENSSLVFFSDYNWVVFDAIFQSWRGWPTPITLLCLHFDIQVLDHYLADFMSCQFSSIIETLKISWICNDSPNPILIKFLSFKCVFNLNFGPFWAKFEMEWPLWPVQISIPQVVVSPWNNGVLKKRIKLWTFEFFRAW